MNHPISSASVGRGGAIAARRLALTPRRVAVARRCKQYAALDNTEIVDAQSLMLKKVWEESVRKEPFYRMWAERHRLPLTIDRVGELADFPRLTKDDLRANHELVFANSSSRKVYSTGGSTGTPVHYPRGRGEAKDRYAGAFVARSWHGIQPGDPYVHLWGASHQFGVGYRVALQQWKRVLLDKALGAVRLNAYDLSPEKLSENASRIWQCDPAFIAGYSSSVVRVARMARSQGLDAASLKRLKAVLVTAETISAADRDLLVEVFRVPVINEYGSAETGAIAVSSGDTWPLRVLWDSVAVTAGESDEINVTTLHPRAFPLINYRVGDRAGGLSVEQGSVLQIQSIEGRGQDRLLMRRAGGGVIVAGAILPTHVLKGISAISSVQVNCENEHCSLYVTADERLDTESTKKFFLDQLAKDGMTPDPLYLHVVQVERPQLTPTGKQLLMLSTSPSPRGTLGHDVDGHEGSAR